jgi:hypothetical protein
MRVADLYESSVDPLSLSPWTFDQDSTTGWRANHDPKQQIATILRYLRRYAASSTRWRPETPKGGHDVEPSLLIFHVGQIYANLGNVSDAIGFFSRAGKTTDAHWNNYVQATIAFLKRDRAAFERYASPENYNKETLDRLRQHWGQSYATAYGGD